MFFQPKQVFIAAALLSTSHAFPQRAEPARPASSVASQPASDQERAALRARIQVLENELAINEMALKNPTLTEQQREGLSIRSKQLTAEVQRLRGQPARSGA